MLTAIRKLRGLGWAFRIHHQNKIEGWLSVIQQIMPEVICETMTFLQVITHFSKFWHSQVLRSPSPFLHYSQGVYIDRLRRSSQSRCRPARPVLGARQRCRAIIEDNLQQYGPLKLQVRDAEILALLVPALGSVFLDPAMQVIDTGKLALYLHSLCTGNRLASFEASAHCAHTAIPASCDQRSAFIILHCSQCKTSLHWHWTKTDSIFGSN